MKLKLICHGMMLFWYRKPSREGAGDDGYRIFIPQGFHDGKLMHEVRFGIGAGAKTPDPRKWLILDETKPVKYSRLELKFGVAGRGTGGVAPSASENLSFYETPDHRAVPYQPGIAFAIDVPYPHDETPIRVATYGANPYEDGRVVQALDVVPRRIVGARMLTFNVANANEDIRLYRSSDNASSLIAPGLVDDEIRLHLYSQPTHVPGSDEDHTEIMNGMLKLEDKSSGELSDFDLTLNDDRQHDIDPAGFGLTPELGFNDFLHLWEYKALYDQSGHGHGGGPSKRYVDPAECGQGGGC